MTLPQLSAGQHTLTVYANDTAGNCAASETIAFTTETATTATIAEPETFPAMPVAVACGVLVAAVTIGFLVYRKKRKR